jgi:PIN domain nuclease of toxin-antitoxin system
MKSLLLDLNALLFYLTQSKRVGRKTQKLLDSSNLFYSSISLFELKFKNLRSPSFRSIVTSENLKALGFSPLQFDDSASEHLVAIDTFDPIDTMLVAQAKSRGMMFLTSDQKILGANLDFVLDLTD